MSALIMWFVFLFLGTVILYVLAVFGFAKKENTEQDNSCVFENNEVRATERSRRENNKASKRAVKKQKDNSIVKDVYYKAYNEAESMMTDYNAAKKITNDSSDLATFEDGYHFDDYAEDFKQEKDSDNENH